MTLSRQLTLPVVPRDDNVLESFLETVNAEALQAVRGLLAGNHPFVYLHGESGTGRTHLLEAALTAMAHDGAAVACVDLAATPRPGPEILEGAGTQAQLVCLDNVDAIAGDPLWEEAVFHLFNEVRAAGGRLLVTAGQPPAHGGWQLPDLRSRLSAGLAVRLAPLADEDRQAILCFRAARRGLELPPETARYLLTRNSRHLGELVGLLGRLDRAALVHRQQRLTVPFVRQWLQAEGQLSGMR